MFASIFVFLSHRVDFMGKECEMVEEPIAEVVAEELISEQDQDWMNFVEAVIWKESRGDASAIGDSGKAVGVLQIHPIMVREANRIMDLKKEDKAHYTYNDRYDRQKSIEIFNIVQGYHNKERDFAKALDIWNHGHPASYYNDIISKYNEIKG